jgi:hypothetical protein
MQSNMLVETAAGVKLIRVRQMFTIRTCGLVCARCCGLVCARFERPPSVGPDENACMPGCSNPDIGGTRHGD